MKAVVNPDIINKIFKTILDATGTDKYTLMWVFVKDCSCSEKQIDENLEICVKAIKELREAK